MAIESGSGTADSPTADEELDATPGADEALVSDPSTDTPSTETPAAEQPEAEERRKPDPKAEAEDTLQAAIDHLSKPGTTAEGDADAKEPSDKTPETKAAAKPADKAKPDEKPAEDPFADWTPEERASIKSKAANRFKAVYDRARKAETSVAEVEQLFEKVKVPRESAERILSTGKAWNDVLDEYQVRSELQHCDDAQVAGMIKTQAAATRVAKAMNEGGTPAEKDLTMLVALQGNLDAVLERAGKSRPQAQPAIPDWTGDLPEKVKDLVSMEMLTADEGKALAAVLDARAKAAAAKAAPAKPAQPVPTSQPKPTPAPRSPAPTSLAASAPRQPAPTPDVVAANKLIARDLAEAGVKPDAVVAHFQKNLVPIIDRMVKEDLGPKAQVEDVAPTLRPEYARRAQREFAANRKPKASAQTPPQARPVEGTKARTPAAAAAQSDLDAAIAFLSQPNPNT